MIRPTICLLSLLPVLALASCAPGPDEQAGDESAPPAEPIADASEDTASPEASPTASDASKGESSLDSGDAELIALGDTAFNTTPGFCRKCHQPGGVGGERAPNLTDDDWVQCDGTIEGIKSVILSGVPKEKHSQPIYEYGMNSAAKMNLDDATVDALAAYVHSLSQ